MPEVTVQVPIFENSAFNLQQEANLASSLEFSMSAEVAKGPETDDSGPMISVRIGEESSLYGTRNMATTLTDLIARAPWREAVTYRRTWPHEYVLSETDGQRQLVDLICERFRNGEGVTCQFFRMKNVYLFVGDYKYWLMTNWDNLKPDVDYVLNRARLYRDRRDFVIQSGDSGMLDDYPSDPAVQRWF